MASLIRFFAITGGMAVVIWGLMTALVTYVEPQPRDMVETIPPSHLGK